MFRTTFMVLAVLTSVMAEEEAQTVQGYAQYQKDACDISVKKALKLGSEEDIVGRCSCYRQDGNDWLCYTTVKPTK